MKVLLFFAGLLLNFPPTQAYPISKQIDTKNSIIPNNGGKKSSKLKKNNTCFKLCNPYKINTFCRLIQVGNYKAVKSLIKKGINVNRQSVKLTPLMYAARHNRVEIVKLLIENGAKLKTKTYNGYTALKWAKQSNAKESYNILQNALKKNTN